MELDIRLIKNMDMKIENIKDKINLLDSFILDLQGNLLVNIL